MKDRDPASRPEDKKARPRITWSEEARRVVQEYIDDLKEIARKLRRRLQ